MFSLTSHSTYANLLFSQAKLGDSDVGDLRCWWQNHYVGDFFRYVGDFLNVLNRSPTSQTCHQHIWSPTSVTNIDVTEKTSLQSKDESFSHAA